MKSIVRGTRGKKYRGGLNPSRAIGAPRGATGVCYRGGKGFIPIRRKCPYVVYVQPVPDDIHKYITSSKPTKGTRFVAYVATPERAMYLCQLFEEQLGTGENDFLGYQWRHSFRATIGGTKRFAWGLTREGFENIHRYLELMGNPLSNSSGNGESSK